MLCWMKYMCTKDRPLHLKKIFLIDATTNFQTVLKHAPHALPEPPLETTVRLIVDYLKAAGMV